MRTTRYPAALFAAALVAGSTHTATAGGIQRPNQISARAVGMGGAFTAIADDPTALYFNPAGLANMQTSDLMIGLELVYAPRSYKPLLTDGTLGEAQEPNGPIIPVPTLGFASRLKREGVPSRLAFGVGVWIPFGGQLDYDVTGDPGIDATTNFVVEIVPGIAYEVNDVLKLGAAVRLGVGLFKVETTRDPSTSDLSANGFGVAASFGVMVTPSDRLSLGFVYRSTMTVNAQGSGVIEPSGADPMDVDIDFNQKWPQQAGFGVAFEPVSALTLSTQVDWTGWARLNTLDPQFPGNEGLEPNAQRDLDWDDNWTFRVGSEYRFSDKVAARLGWLWDTRAVPTRTQERQFADSSKSTVAAGASFGIGDSWRIDTAIDVLLPLGATEIENNDDVFGAWRERANHAPGEHDSSLYTLELAAHWLF